MFVGCSKMLFIRVYVNTLSWESTSERAHLDPRQSEAVSQGIRAVKYFCQGLLPINRMSCCQKS